MHLICRFKNRCADHIFLNGHPYSVIVHFKKLVMMNEKKKTSFVVAIYIDAVVISLEAIRYCMQNANQQQNQFSMSCSKFSHALI